MGKRRSWIEAVKKIFGSDDSSTKEKKEKRKIWFFSKLRSRRAITMPVAASKKAKSMKEVEEEQSKRAMAVAVATAAAAEAAVAAAQAAAVVVRLTGAPPSYRRSRDVAAIKIQTAFRGYLARKALRALKAIVKLQALVRGRAVRRQTSLTLRSLQSLMKIQEQVRSHRLRVAEDRRSDLNSHPPRRYSSIKGLERSWNSSSMSKEEIMAIISHRQEAALRRERSMEYASINQRRRSVCSTESSRSWLDQWVKNQNVDWDLGQSVGETTKLRRFLRDDESVTSSPAMPSYMAATEATRARSASTPKRRMGSPHRQGTGEVRMSPRLKARQRPPSQINHLD